MNNNLKHKLISLGLSPYEAEVYMLLSSRAGMTHLELSRELGINRSKMYRIIDDLSKRSIVHIGTDEKKKVFAAHPDVLKVSVVDAEEKLEKKRAALADALPQLQSLIELQSSPLNFKVSTYEGTEGFKQMLWNELKTKGEIVIFGSGKIEDLVDSHAWAEKHRAKTKEVNYTIREIKSSNDHVKRTKFTDVKDFEQQFQVRYIDETDVDFKHQIAIYNDTVATYCYRDGQKVGIEIINRANADFYRDIFERYWADATA